MCRYMYLEWVYVEVLYLDNDVLLLDVSFLPGLTEVQPCREGQTREVKRDDCAGHAAV